MPPKKTSPIKPKILPADPSDSSSKSRFVNDKWVAGQLMMKAGTIRVQRCLRKQGKPHWFDVEPTFVGTSPRYLREEVKAWLRRLSDNKSPQMNNLPQSKVRNTCSLAPLKKELLHVRKI